MNSPLVSVIIPVYNGARYLAEAVASVQVQSAAPVEIIIVDDGSTDETLQIAASLKGNVHILERAHRGAPAARNQGLESARGEFITFLDADDLWAPNRLETQVRLLLEHSDYDAVIGNIQLVRHAQEMDGTAALVPMAPPQAALSISAALIRRSAFLQAGMLDERQLYADDVEWLLRARAAGVQIVYHEDLVLLYRRHTQNLTNDADTNTRYLLQALYRSAVRQRGRGESPAKLSPPTGDAN